MMKRLAQLLFATLALFNFVARSQDSRQISEPDWRNTKMLWAHFVGWGFDQHEMYDNIWDYDGNRARPLTDRTLRGKYTQARNGLWDGTRSQVRCAMEYGFDGFCVDLFRDFGNNMSRFYTASEGTPFKVALCVDGGFERDALVNDLADYFARYKNHPNSCQIDGRMVVFIYTAAVSLEDWRYVISELRKRGHEGYWLKRPIPESDLWTDLKTLKEHLAIFDGFYDFGRNGFYPSEQDLCVANAKKVIAKVKPNAIYVGGITPGYMNSIVGFYRPFQNTRTLRDNWQALIKGNADWACVTTWNDYIEHTHFEPSAINRDVLARLNQEYCNEWRKTPIIRRPAAPFFGYHEYVAMGMDFTLDVTCPPYTEEPATVHVRILNLAGAVIKQLEPVAMKPEIIDYYQWRITAEEMRDWHDGFRVQAAVATTGGEPPWREMAPVAICYNRMHNLRTQRLAWDEMVNVSPTLAIRDTEDGPVADITIRAWSHAGKLEVFCNGWPAALGEYNISGQPETTVTLPLNPNLAKHLYDYPHFFTARVTATSDQIGWTNPVITCNPDDGLASQPVIMTGNDMEEDWPIWSHRTSRTQKNTIEMRPISAAENFHYSVDFSQPFSNETWMEEADGRFPVKNGAQHWNWYVSDPENCATQQQTEGPDGTETNVLHFDGNDMVAFPTRTMSYGAYTISLLIRPDQNPNRTQILFNESNGSCYLTLNEQLFPVIDSRNTILTGNAPLLEGQWQLLKVVYTGSKLQLFLDGAKIGETDAAPTVLICNSAPTIGADIFGKNGFIGDILSVTLRCGIEEN